MSNALRKSLHMSVALAGAAFVLAACANGSGTSSPGNAYGGAAAAASAPAASRAVLSAASTSLGTVLVDGHGKAGYQFAANKPGMSSCSGSCLQYWPPVIAPSSVPPSVPGVTGK